MRIYLSINFYYTIIILNGILNKLISLINLQFPSTHFFIARFHSKSFHVIISRVVVIRTLVINSALRIKDNGYFRKRIQIKKNYMAIDIDK